MACVLYVVSREKPELYEQLYEDLRRDMETATVELTFDRRRGERRRRAEHAGAEHRLADRRQRHIEEELARSGWARVEIDSAGERDEGAGRTDAAPPRDSR